MESGKLIAYGKPSAIGVRNPGYSSGALPGYEGTMGGVAELSDTGIGYADSGDILEGEIGSGFLYLYGPLRGGITAETQRNQVVKDSAPLR